MNDEIPAGLPADLRYVDDRTPGIRRRKLRGRFVYFQPSGERIREAAEITRIDQLAIPPAYREVWICIDPCGHLQATGRDARGRKQYRYHPRWIELRDAAKYERLLRFGEALPGLRGRIDGYLAEPGLGRQKVMATVVALLDNTLIRIGNRRYARDNRSFGLTTLCNRHVDVSGSTIRFAFRGKSGVKHSVRISHPRLARILRRCLELPGQQLFQYLDEQRQRRPLGSGDINDFLRQHAGEDFTAKDYRTWAGSALALELCRKRRCADGATAGRQLAEIVGLVAAELGNTPAICRKCYIHPAIIEAFLAGELAGLRKARRRKGLSSEEATLLAFLRQRCPKR
ncbi:DNA topoisomerase IB [Pseudomonas jinjuensis]|uniref:DNA topoisomerase n=1 Tax=Pseudomonas jinjuensis TaxID=198616 RepID=A0A1H0LQJ9_9PSED|nr:DNA topoisomerase IB [Pseudomonas jinjuensis]SDO70301.1 DNA topoisomerase-1 [Pseudomonas jinjuensis]